MAGGGALGPGAQVAAGLGTGLAGGVLSGMFGIGGGIVMVPLLGLVLGLDQHRAQGVTLAAMLLPNGLPAVLHYRARGVPILWKLVGLLILGFLGGVWAGSELANRIPEAPLRWGFTGLLLVMAVRMLSGKGPAREGAAPLAAIPAGRWVVVLAIGAVGGTSSGLLGIGGGLVIIPLLAGLLAMPQHQAQATSLAVMLPPIFLPGVLVYAAQRGLPWAIIAGVAGGFMVGAFLGARLATSVKGPSLRIAFAAVMAVMAVLLLRR